MRYFIIIVLSGSRQNFAHAKHLPGREGVSYFTADTFQTYPIFVLPSDKWKLSILKSVKNSLDPEQLENWCTMTDLGVVMRIIKLKLFPVPVN